MQFARVPDTPPLHTNTVLGIIPASLRFVLTHLCQQRDNCRVLSFVGWPGLEWHTIIYSTGVLVLSITKKQAINSRTLKKHNYTHNYLATWLVFPKLVNYC